MITSASRLHLAERSIDSLALAQHEALVFIHIMRIDMVDGTGGERLD